jgi:hypothetical protein
MNPEELLKKVQEDQLYQDWQKQHPQGFLSHFFCSLDENINEKSNWDTGFYDPEAEKITVFTEVNGKQIIKPADDVFKKKEMKVEELDLSLVKISYDEAKKIFTENFSEYFPGEIKGDGFIVLQKFQGKTEWNFTFISKKIKFLNLKVSVEDGKVNSHETINLVQ